MIDETPELREKLKFLVKAPEARAVSKRRAQAEITSLPRLAKVMELGRTNLYPENGRLSDRVADKLRQIYGIDENSECWGEFVAGCAREFAKEYRKLDPFPPEATEKCRANGPSRQPNEQHPVVLVEDISAPPNKYQTELASVQPRFAQMEPVPGEVTLTFDLNCPQLFAEDERTGVKRGILVFQCGDARTTKAEERTGYPNGLEIDSVRISIRSVDQNVPSWMIESIEGNNIGLIAKVPEEFIQIVNMKPGYVISVEFCAYVKDTASTFDLSESGDTSAAKRKIKKRLSQMSLKEGEQGSSLLAKAEMRFIEGEV